MSIAFSIVVAGEVQGVGFRYYTKQEADRLGLQGTVRNMRDGTVEIYVQGEEEPVKDLLSWCHAGPQSAHVEQLDYEAAKIQDFDGFEILR